MQGINAISPTGRALQAATENMTPEQQQQYLMHQQQAGVPLSPELALMMIQLNKLKQAKPPAPPPTQTVKQELDASTMGGVASLPVSEKMYETKGMAGGGLVAFAEAGAVGTAVAGDFAAVPRVAAAGDFGMTAEQAAAYNRLPPTKKASFLSRLRSATTGTSRFNPNVKVGGLGSLKTAGKFAGKAAAVAAPISLGMTAADLGTTDTQDIADYYGKPAGESLIGDLLLRGRAAVDDILPFGNDPLGSIAARKQAAAAAPAPATESGALASDELSAYLASLRPGPDGAGGSSSFGVRVPGRGNVDAAYAQAEADMAAERKGLDKRTEEELIAEAKARRVAAGEGKAREKRAGEIADELAQMPKDQRRDAWMAAANAFFKMGEAAGSTGSFAEAASTGALSGIDQYGKDTDKREAKADRLKDSRFTVEQAGEAAAMGDLERGSAQFARNRGEMRELGKEARQMRVRKAETEVQVAMQQAQLEASMSIARIAQADKAEGITLQRAYVGILRDTGIDDATRTRLLGDLLVHIQNLEQASNYQYALGQDKIAATNTFGSAAAPATPGGGFVVLGKE